MFVVVAIGRDGVVAMESSFDTDDLWERYLGRDPDARVTVYESVRADDVRRIAGPCAVPDLGAALVGVRDL